MDEIHSCFFIPDPGFDPCCGPFLNCSFNFSSVAARCFATSNIRSLALAGLLPFFPGPLLPLLLFE